MRASTLLWTALAVLCTAAAAQPQRHDRIFVLPASKPAAVDGDLGEWDLSGAIETAFDESLRPRFTVRIAAMYDQSALYLAAHFADDTPLVNRHDPKVEPDRGWDADCLQVRLSSDPAAPYPLPGSNSDRICHLTLWLYTDRQEPVLHVQYGMDYHGTRVLIGQESGLAFRKDADGKGYTLEARLPWELLNAKGNPPKAGGRIAMVVQPLWGDGTGWKQVCTFNDVIREAGFSFQGTGMWGQAVLSEKGNLPPAERPKTVQEALEPLTLDVRLPDRSARSVSMAVFDDKDQLVRTLPVITRDPNNLPRVSNPREVTVKWDGLDDDGRPLPPGKYAAKVLTHRGIGQKYVASLHNAGNPPWRTDDGTGSWGGDHGQPIGATSDGERVYLAWQISEAGWALVAMKKDFTPDGKVQKLWGQHQVLDIGILITAVAADGERLFVAQDGGPWGHETGKPYRAGIVLWEAKSGRPINFPFGKRTLLLSEWPESIKPPELQTYERLSIYHPLVTHKRFWERMRDGDLGPQQLGLNLLGMAVVGDVLYASLYFENKIVAVNWKTGQKVREFAVPKPVGLAAARDGSLLAISGKTVVRIDPQSAQVTPVVSQGLSWPWGIALDAEGRIYVTDCGTAMQVKIFDPQGKPIGTIGRPGGRPWVGRYDPLGMLMPSGVHVDAQGRVWVMEFDSTPKRISVWTRDGRLLYDLLGGGAYAVEGIADERHPNLINVHATVFDLNYRTGKAKTVATLVRPQMKGFQFTPDEGYMGRAFKFRHVGGKDYLAHAGRGCVVIYRMDKDFVGEPVSAVGPAGALPLHGFIKQDIPETIRDEYWRNSHAFAFSWARSVGAPLSGRPQEGGHVGPPLRPEELTIEKVSPFWSLYWGSWVDDDLTIWSAGGGGVWRVPVKEWRPDGTPVYPRPSEQKPLFKALGDQLHHVLPTDGGVYVLEQLGGNTQTGQGRHWSAVSRYALEGRRLWAYRRCWLGFGLDAPLAKPGDVVGAMKFIGRVKLGRSLELVAVNGYFGQFNLLSSDGLWVASLCHDNRYGPRADATTVWPENFSGWFYRNRDNGRVYLIAGDTDARIWEVTGLDDIETTTVPFTFTEADRQKALDASLRRQGSSSTLAPIPALYVPRPAGRPVIVMGEEDPKVDAGAGRSMAAGLRCTDKYLYIRFEVQDDSPMKNSGKDPGLLFKTGDACDLMLATDPEADPKRTRPAKGDIRLLFSELDGKPVCVLYEPVARTAERQPRLFSSPTGAESFDRVVMLDGMHISVSRTEKGYSIYAEVPLKAIGFAPKAGMITRGDVGVIFSDPGGSRNVLRAYHFNKDTAIVNDIPSEVRLAPDKWGIVRVE